jgi:glucan phosphoethanolaminetransferase (alkaline phosphatase superfamily)
MNYLKYVRMIFVLVMVLVMVFLFVFILSDTNNNENILVSVIIGVIIAYITFFFIEYRITKKLQNNKKFYKPIKRLVSAIQYTGTNYDDVEEFCSEIQRDLSITGTFNNSLSLINDNSEKVCRIFDYIVHDRGVYYIYTKEEFDKHFVNLN